MINNIGKEKLRLDIITERFLFEVIRILSSDTIVTKRFIANINRLFDAIDLEYYYERNNEIAALIKAIKIIMNIKKIDNVFDTNGAIVEIQMNIQNEMYEEFLNNSIIPLIESSARKDYKHKYEEISRTIITYLQYGFVLNIKNEIVSQINDMESSYGSELLDNIMKFRSIVSLLNEYFRTTETNNLFSNLVSMADSEFFDSLIETYNEVVNPKKRLKVGIKALNKFLSYHGGFLPGLYIFYSLTNEGKSALLEEIAVQMQRNNDDIFELPEFKNNNIIPTILYISLENSKTEDNERFFKMFNFIDIESLPNKNAVINRWRSSYFRGKTENDRYIDIVIYRPSDETGEIKPKFRPSDLLNTIEDLNEEGRKVIAVEIDYFEPMDNEKEDERKELRIQYFIRSDALNRIAKRFKIPIITAHQLNREASGIISEMRREGNLNLIHQLSSKYIGESFAIEKPATFTAFILREVHPVTKKVYLAFKRAKCRGRFEPGSEIFFHEIIDGIRLPEDINLPESLSKKSLTVEENPNIEESFVNSALNSRGRIKPTNTAKDAEKNKPIVIKPAEDDTLIGNVLGALIKSFNIRNKHVWNDNSRISEDNHVINKGYVWNK